MSGNASISPLPPTLLRVGLPWGRVLPLWNESDTVAYVEITAPAIAPTRFVGNRQLPAVLSHADLSDVGSGKVPTEEVVFGTQRTNAGWEHLEVNLRVANGTKPSLDGRRQIPTYAEVVEHVGVKPTAAPHEKPYDPKHVKEFAAMLGRMMMAALSAGESFWLLAPAHTPTAPPTVVLRCQGAPLPDSRLGFHLATPFSPRDRSWASAQTLANSSHRVLQFAVAAQELLGPELDQAPTTRTLISLARPATTAVLEHCHPWQLRPVYARPEHLFAN